MAAIAKCEALTAAATASAAEVAVPHNAVLAEYTTIMAATTAISVAEEPGSSAEAEVIKQVAEATVATAASTAAAETCRNAAEAAVIKAAEVEAVASNRTARFAAGYIDSLVEELVACTHTS
jgi:hypothetical protein